VLPSRPLHHWPYWIVSLIKSLAHWPHRRHRRHRRHRPRPHSLISLNGLFGSSANQLRQPRWLINSSAVSWSHHSCRSNKNNMAAQASSSTRSCHGAIEHYRHCQRRLTLLSNRLVVSLAFTREGENVVVACSCQEKVVLVACLFWQILQRWHVTIRKTIIFSQASANDKILRHEGVWEYLVMDSLC